MKVYGFDLNSPVNGEILCAEVSSDDVAWGMEAVRDSLGWEYASKSFSTTQKKLMSEMRDEDTDPEMIELVNKLKAKDLRP